MGIDPHIATGRQKHHEAPVPPEAAAPSAEAAAPSAEASAKEKMQSKLRTATGKALYAARKHIVEPVFGMIKSARGIRKFLLRRPGESVGRVATDMLDPQSFEDLAPLLQRRGRLRGIVRAQGWARLMRTCY